MTTSTPTLSIPVLGDGATFQMWTDRIAGTVTAISASGKTVTVTEDDVEWKPFPSGYAEGYRPNPNGSTHTVRLTKKGWRSAGMRVTFGVRAAYRDPSF